MIDNEFYKELGEKWFMAEGDAIALLRQENETKLPWVLKKIKQHHGIAGMRVLDVGCGGGFLALGMAAKGHRCTGLDVSPEILNVGRKRDPEGRLDWVVGQADRLPFGEGSFDVVCIMDVLEHVNNVPRVLAEATRVLSEDGLLLLHTFNRTWLAWLFAARGLDWFIKDSPSRIHDWNLFIKPVEIEDCLRTLGFQVEEFTGIHPVFFSREFLNLILTRRVPKTFRFAVGGGLGVGYLAAAVRLERADVAEV